ncbi:hypothetical protein N7474_008304 [Penicillium riverlandense]|uniref:uncharacterized protein n=1 Tax=Penicillium riverlandense TaxID=1903569 RepID=UPI0025471E60|nr:uncharacterized protein N7474_008304 [Penicillium riverlandense]KAJ5812003.1 hypothetical protein N7474_008304 [Penicillium riverlandense]
MGSAASKPARTAAGAAARRQYPKQPAPSTRGPLSSPATAPSDTNAAPTPTPTPTSAPTPTAAQPPQPSQAPTSQGPTYHSKEQPSSVKSNAIDLDGRDPDFAASLRSIGPVNPSPTLSHSSTFNRQDTSPQTVFPQGTNPALLVLKARQQIAKAAEDEAEQIGLTGRGGRQFVDAFTIQSALRMRDRQGLPQAEIERLLRLSPGVMEKLGKDGLVSPVA